MLSYSELLLHPIGHAFVQPILKLVQGQCTTQTVVPFLNSLILPQLEFISLEAPGLNPGEVALVVFLIDTQRILPIVAFQFLQIRFLRRKLLASAEFAFRNAVAVGPVAVALDDEIPSAGQARWDGNFYPGRIQEVPGTPSARGRDTADNSPAPSLLPEQTAEGKQPCISRSKKSR